MKLVALPRLAILPEHHVPFSLRDDNHGARAVTVKGAPAAGGKLGNVTAVGGVGERKAHMPDAFALHRELVERKLIDVRNEIRFPVAIRHVLIETKKFVTRVKPIAKLERIPENKILIVKDVDHARARGSGKETHRLARTIEVLVGRIERNCEDRPRAPFADQYCFRHVALHLFVQRRGFSSRQIGDRRAINRFWSSDCLFFAVDRFHMIGPISI